MLVFAALALMACALEAIYLYHSWHHVKRENLQSVTRITELSASSVALFLREQRTSLPSFARQMLEDGAHLDPIARDQRLRRFKSINPEVAAIYLFSPQGELLAGTTAPTGSPNTSQHMRDPVFRADFEAALRESDIVIGHTRYGKLIGDWIMPVRVRAVDANGAPVFVISAVFTMGRQQGLWRDMTLPAGWAVGLMRDDGYLQARYPVPSDAAASFSSPHGGELAQWLKANTAHNAVTAEGAGSFSGADSVLLAAKRIPEFAMTAYAHMPARQQWSTWFEHIRVPVWLFLLALAAIGAAAWWTLRQQREREWERSSAHQALRAAGAALQRQTQLLEQSQRAAKIGGWELDIASGALYWTDETYRIHEVAAQDYSPSLNTVLNFYAPESAQLMNWALQRAKRTGESWDHELEVVTYRGNRVWVRSIGKGELDSAGNVVRLWGSYQDITQRRATEEQIRHLAHYDSVTGLANRNLFMAHLSHAIDRAKRVGSQLAVLFIDLDRFKHINDAVGHGVGDTVLKQIAARLAGAVRASDVLARLGGDEFIVAAEDFGDREAVRFLASRMLAAVAEPIVVGEDEFVLTASVGVAMFPTEGNDVASLIKNADVAMYRAKEAGKNCFEFYSEEMRLASAQRLTMEAQLRKALLDGNQLVLHYQPRIAVESGRIGGAEALVRWQHPERGLVQPADFIPLAEESGLIQPLGAWVLRIACAQAAQWQRRTGEAQQVAVNLSARELYRANLVADVRSVLAETRLAPQSLELEITETIMLHNLQQVAEVLNELKQLGVRLTVDDFGTGYSSLAHLKRLPLDCIKIDRSFIRDIPEDKDGAAIARAVIAMAHSLRLTVVAEGVETEAQLQFLQELGCDEVQGYLHSPPVSADALLGLLMQESRTQQRARAVYH